MVPTSSALPAPGERASPGRIQDGPGQRGRGRAGGAREQVPAEAELPLMIKGPLVTHAEKSSSDPRWKRSRAGRAGDAPAPAASPRRPPKPQTQPPPPAGFLGAFSRQELSPTGGLHLTPTYRSHGTPLPPGDRPQVRCPHGTPAAHATGHAGHCPPTRSGLSDRPQNKVPLSLRPLARPVFQLHEDT